MEERRGLIKIKKTYFSNFNLKIQEKKGGKRNKRRKSIIFL